MKLIVPIATLVLVVASLLVHRLGTPLSDFWQGLITGLAITGLIYSLAAFWKKPGARR
ncbi:hypothetical protein ACTHPH_14295 [Paenibacillus pasadenensis]|uniref:Uncharacterized protein n=1 Tax=Paenibacillus pasadenensis TaxID=217090 RepID=A0A2N5N2L7_9BACL|nr:MULTISPECIES: hypothetical protein [Paenibacillus]PLT44569.1 hypothetical protein B8V81_3000 [Paenibacillus pasadenensis]QGG55066.1 hypothetical protein GE073_05355 [Paenibacillus sp. B01]